MVESSITTLKMTNYNFVKELATFAFVRESGGSAVIVIQRETFGKLMRGDYDKDSTELKASDLQSSFKRVVAKEIKENYDEWFTAEANKICSEFLAGR